MSSKQKKQQQLGMNPATAANRLRKMLMFTMMQELNEDFCYHCGNRIVHLNDLSIEHMVPWLDSDDPVGLYFDTSNLAFSHLSCNSGARNRGKTHCPQGHKYSHQDKNGDRRCRECKQKQRRQFRERHPEQDKTKYRQKMGWLT